MCCPYTVHDNIYFLKFSLVSCNGSFDNVIWTVSQIFENILLKTSIMATLNLKATPQQFPCLRTFTIIYKVP